MEHEDYVGFEQATALKKLGFDWKCYTFYHQDNWCGLSHSGMCENHNMFKMCFSAPTLAQAQKWLREEKKITILIDILSNKKKQFYWKLYDNNLHFNGASNANYNSYEQALSAGIDKAIELLKEESK